jgi:Zn finger protein HypA/HybF involved in hydrogenase expression
MTPGFKNSALILCASTLCALAVFIVTSARPIVTGQLSQRDKWNPRRVPAGTEFIGDQACGECHKRAFAPFARAGMALAMEPVAESKVLTENPKLTLQLGPYSYEIRRQGKQSFYSVTDGKNTISVPIEYAVGQGRMGQTYVLQREGKFYESRMSFYDETKGLDFTIGSPRDVPPSLEEAFGRLLSNSEVLSCFSCHSNGAISGQRLQLEKLTHGVRCESCHGPGGPHVAAVKAGEPGYKSIFNPGRLSGDEQTQQFCASCHRGNEEFSMLRTMEVNNVRFQPYRIFHSKCYSDDRNIRCTACHNPHEPLREDSAYYDSRCLACHALKGQPIAQGSLPSCPVATKDCVSCHMPKVEIKSAHFKFTDHYIRIVKPGEKYPN